MKRKYPKIHKEPVGSLTSNRRGSSPFDPPVKYQTSVMDEGERHGVTVGETSPLRRYQRGHFLFDTLLVPFLVKEKESREWAA